MKNKVFGIFKKAAAFLLAAVLMLSFAACKDNGVSEKPDDVVLPEKKVAILVAPESQYPEDYRAAKELAEKYPDNVIVKEYSDSRVLRAGDPEIKQYSKELAENSEIGAIIYARATQFTTNAIAAAKEVNPDIVTVCIEPEESVEKISEAADLVLCADWSKAAEDIVAAAKEQGAKYFVVYSFNRHITNNPLIRAENDAIKTACEAQGITYIYESSLDPIYPTLGNASKYIKESVARLINNNAIEGKDVVLFSTDGTVQSTLVEVANEKGFIYICPSFPTAYNGIGEVYEAAIPESVNDTAAYIASLKAAVEADTAGTARLNVYSFPLASKLLTGALYSAFDILSGTTTADNLAEKVQARVSAAADNEKFTVEAYNTVLKNTFKAYCPGFEKIK